MTIFGLRWEQVSSMWNKNRTKAENGSFWIKKSVHFTTVLYNTLYLTLTPQHIHCYCFLWKLLEVPSGCGWRKIHQPTIKGGQHIVLFMWKFLTANASDDQSLLRAAVSHGPLCYLHQHGEQGLLRSPRCQNNKQLAGLYFTFHSSYLCENLRVLRANYKFTERIYA